MGFVLGLNLGYIDTPQEWRDLCIRMFMVAGTIAILLIIITTLVTGFMSWTILGQIRPQIGHIYGYKLEPVPEVAGDACESG